MAKGEEFFSTHAVAPCHCKGLVYARAVSVLFYCNRGSAAADGSALSLKDNILIIVYINKDIYHVLAILRGLHALLYPPAKWIVLEGHSGGVGIGLFYETAKGVVGVVDGVTITVRAREDMAVKIIGRR